MMIFTSIEQDSNVGIDPPFDIEYTVLIVTALVAVLAAFVHDAST